MKTTSIVFLSLFILTPFVLRAQTDVDALRYSQTGIAGTARFISMAGAFGALGGDFSTLSWNPAGIAIYRKSEFTFSPSLYLEKSTSDFMNNSGSANKYNFNFGNLGLVFTRKLSNNDASSGWKNWNLGFGYNRLNNFHTKTFYEGMNLQNSMLDNFIEHLNAGQGTTPENIADLYPFYENLAYQTYLVNNPDTLNPNYYTSVIPSGGEVQRRTSTTKGAMSEIVISFGANYSNKFYLGGTLGFASVRYIEESSYEEIDQTNSIFDFNSFRLNQKVTTHGYGINLKLGMIYRAADWIRLGAAFHTPTFYSMSDDFSNTMSSKFDNGDNYTYDSPLGTYDYNLTTPMRAIGSIAFIVGKIGLVSADYEFVDYSEPRFDASGNSFFDVNNKIQKNYTASGNLKIGTEWRYEDLSFRGGYAMFGSPFESGYKISGADMSRNCYSLGIGFRDADYFLDLGYVLSEGTEYFLPYTISAQENVQGVKNTIQTHNLTITLGAKF